MVLNTVEEWTVSDRTGTIHPFHIHVNPFFVTKYNGVELGADHPRRRWQDTVALPKTGSVTFRMNFADFTGKFVLHCHNLVHEDGGMMKTVQIVAPPG